MTRKDFLVQMGIGAGAAALLSCVTGCSNTNNVSPSAPTADFTIDLTASANHALLTKGGFIYQSGVIVAFTNKGVYVALSEACTHEGYNVQYDPQSDSFYCPAHGSDFSDNGSVNNGPASVGLKSYTVTRSGNSLHIKS
jgi:cytochrome b6-f complex iron-sulfur subunit